MKKQEMKSNSPNIYYTNDELDEIKLKEINNCHTRWLPMEKYNGNKK